MEDIANFAHKIMIVSDAKLVSYDYPNEIFKDSQMLKNIGLNVPQVTRVVNHLRQKGIDLGDNIYTVDAAVEAILKYVKEES